MSNEARIGLVSLPDPINRDVWINPLPPHDPIDWSAANEWHFTNGAMKVETMTRAEFERRYPKV